MLARVQKRLVWIDKTFRHPPLLLSCVSRRNVVTDPRIFSERSRDTLPHKPSRAVFSAMIERSVAPCGTACLQYVQNQ